MLLREPFVGCQEEDAVQLAPPTMPGQGFLILQNVDVHQQRLPAAGRHPEGELVELWPSLHRLVERRDPVSLGLVRIVGVHLLIQLHKQRIGVAKVAVQIDLGEEQGQVLEILPDDRVLAASNTPFV